LLWYRHSHLLGNAPDGFRESDVLDLLYEGKDIALLPASEAVKELPGRMHGKRRRLLFVKRTETNEVLRSGFLELDIIADDADDVRLLFQVLRK
jgi:hypothetical protein